MSKFLSFKDITIFYIQDFPGSEIYTAFDKKEHVESDESGHEVPRATGAVLKENARFFTLKEAYRCISERKHPVLNKIPFGDKSNCFLLLNVDLLAKDSLGRIKYFDDCRVYGSSSRHKWLLFSVVGNLVWMSLGYLLLPELVTKIGKFF